MAPTYDSITSIRIAAGTGTLTGTFDNISLPANCGLAVAAASNGGSTNTPAITVTSPNVTWTNSVTATGAGSTRGRATVATGTNVTGRTETITVTVTGQDAGAGDTNATLYVMTDVDLAALVGNTDTYSVNDNDPDTATAAEAEITTSRNNSLIIWAALDWEATALATPTVSNATATADDNYVVSGESTHYAVHTAVVATSGTVTRLGINVTGDGDWICAGLEIKASSVSAVTLTPVTLTLTGQTLSPTAGTPAVTLTPVTLTMTAQALSLTPGTPSVTLTPVSLTMAAQSLAPTAGTPSVTLTPVALTIAAETPSPTAGESTVTLTPVVLTLTAVSVSLGTEETLEFPPPVLTDLDDASLLVLGTEFESDEDGFWLGCEWDVPDSVAANNHYIQAFIKTGSNTADWIQSKLFTPVPGTRQKIYFDDPIDILAVEDYVAVVLTQHYTATANFTWPHTNGHLTAPSGVNGRFAGTAADTATFPNNISGNEACYHISPIFATQSVTPSTVTLTPVTLTLSPEPVAPVAGVSSVTLTPVSLTLTAQTLAPVAEASQVTLTPVVLVLQVGRMWMPKVPAAPYTLGTEIGVPTGTTLTDRFPVGTPDGVETVEIWNPYTNERRTKSVIVWEGKRFTTDTITPSPGVNETFLFRNCKFDIAAVNRLLELSETNARSDVMDPIGILDHCEVDGHNSSTRGIVGSYLWLLYTDIRNCEDGWAGLAYSLAWRCNFLAANDGGPDPHADGTQMSGTGFSFTLECWCSGGPDTNATNSGQRYGTESSAVTRIVMQYNAYDYGGYSLQVRGDAGLGPGIDNVTVEHSRWTRNHLYGPVDFQQVDGNTLVWNDNAYFDGEGIINPVTGTSVTLTPVDLALSAVSVVPSVAGATQVTLAPVQLSLTPLTLAPVSGIVTVTLTPVTLTLSATAVTPTVGVGLATVELILVAVPLSPVAGVSTVVLTPVQLTITAVAASPSAGLVSVTLTPVQLALAAIVLGTFAGVIHEPRTPNISIALTRPRVGVDISRRKTTTKLIIN